MRRLKRIVYGVIGFLLLFVTVPKLMGMARIVGWVPGAVHHKGAVEEVWKGTGAYGIENYNVRWTLMQEDGQRPVTGVDQCQLGPWRTLRAGSEIDLVTVPGDRRIFYAKSIWVEPGNFTFDFILVAIELISVVVAIFAIFPTGNVSWGSTAPGPR